MISFVEFLDDETKKNITIYINNLNYIDIHVRDMTNYEIYIYDKIPSNCKRIIASDIEKINQKLKVYKSLYDITWKIAILQINVENNLPHTHNDVIFLPHTFLKLDNKSRLEVLLHEKIHVFQRKYPIQTHILYTKYWSVVPCSLRSYEEPFRSNPDINHIIFAYFSPDKNLFVYNAAIYHDRALKIKDSYVKSEPSKNITDTNRGQSTTYYTLIHEYDIKQTEHPNEVMACIITDIVMNNVEHESTIEWMKKYLID
jgi:hypothetical protein